MVILKAAIFVVLVAITAWSGANLAYRAWLVYPTWDVVATGGALACAYCLGDILFRRNEWIGLRRYEGPRRRMAWGPWR